jgi:hypothetical protein
MQVRSADLWVVAAVTAAVDLLLAVALIKTVSRGLFRRSLAWLIACGMSFWCVLLTAAGWGYWDECYGLIFPTWVRWVVPLYGLLVGAVLGPLFWWAARRLPGHPVLPFIALAGLHSLPGHLRGIYAEDLLERCAMLAGVTPASALVFGIFEFIFYWSVVLGLAALATTLRARRRRDTNERL